MNLRGTTPFHTVVSIGSWSVCDETGSNGIHFDLFVEDFAEADRNSTTRLFSILTEVHSIQRRASKFENKAKRMLFYTKNGTINLFGTRQAIEWRVVVIDMLNDEFYPWARTH